MREIKFRAWVKSMKRFYNISGFMEKTDRTHGYKVMSLFFGDGFGTWEADDVILIQYTGLKDKHGKEIYEGDMVKVYSEVIREVVFKHAFWQMEEREMIQANVLGGFGTPQEEAHKPLYRYPERNIEIIGNIYENPDLLNSDTNDKRSVASKAK